MLAEFGSEGLVCVLPRTQASTGCANQRATSTLWQQCLEQRLATPGCGARYDPSVFNATCLLHAETPALSQACLCAWQPPDCRSPRSGCAGHCHASFSAQHCGRSDLLSAQGQHARAGACSLLGVHARCGSANAMAQPGKLCRQSSRQHGQTRTCTWPFGDRR
jgi:hypothetical protein